MRITFIIGFTDNIIKERKFPNNYRQSIVAFLKDCIRNADEEFKNKLWGESKTETNYIKPFTFSVYLPHAKAEGKIIKFTSSEFIINFSFGNYNINKDERLIKEINGFDFFTNFYNGLLKRKYDFILDFSNFDGDKYNIYLKRAFVRPEKIISDKTTFKTLSPVIIRKTNINNGNEWLLPDSLEFNEWLKKSIIGLSKRFIQIDDYEINFKPASIKKVNISHHNDHIIGFSGSFILEAPVEINKLIYEVGIGAKRSEGFGMLEVV